MCRGRGWSSSPASKSPPCASGRDVHVLGYFIDITSQALLDVSRRATPAAHRSCPPDDRRISPASGSPSMPRRCSGRRLTTRESPRAVLGSRARWSPADTRPTSARRLTAGSRRDDQPSCRASVRRPTRWSRAFMRRAASPRWRTRGFSRRDEWIAGLVSSGLDALEAYHSEHDADTTARYLAMATSLGAAVSGGSDYHGSESHGPDRPGAVSLPREEYERLVRLKPDGLRATRRATASGESVSS